MPRISVFYGIEILMHFNEHGPPRFHAGYQGFAAQVRIADGAVLAGSLPPRVRRLVREWARMYTKELTRAWVTAKAGVAPDPIPPLE